MYFRYGNSSFDISDMVTGLFLIDQRASFVTQTWQPLCQLTTLITAFLSQALFKSALLMFE